MSKQTNSQKTFKPVDNRQDFVQMEEDVQKFWEENDVLPAYLKKNEDSGKRFSFIDGPITANGPMGLHHAWGRSYKDLVQRYKNMKGFKQRFQNGFDCQGLWVEVEVEKDLNFNSKKDIEEYGLDNFTNACKARVNKFAAIQTEQSKRLGMFMDWDNSYYTMSEENNLAIWAFLKIAHEKGLLYKGQAPTAWCPRCETGLSQHEQADDYKDIEDTSVYVIFKLKGQAKSATGQEYLLAWTTTPWTLVANVLLAVNPKFQYVRVEHEGKKLIMLKEAAEKFGFTEMEDVDITEYIDLEYETLLDVPAQKGVEHKVVEWDLVEATSGSGIVHIAPGCGAEDFELGEEVGAAKLAPIDTAGVFIDGYGQLTGKNAHDVADEVIEMLKEVDALFKVEQYTHSYPHCWRCKTKVLFRLEDNWFLKVSAIRNELKDAAAKANWIPEHMLKRMYDWLDNMGDWMISRKRFYGLSLPFYKCEKCGHVHVVGSKEELKERAVDPKKVDELPSLHRPWIDEIDIKCPKCDATAHRIEDVGDCWLDAGVVPFSTLKYFDDREYWEKWFPGEFVTEMQEQVRLWFYSMLVFGVVLEGQVPYQNVLAFAELRDQNNEKISKTKKNGIPYDEAIKMGGADIIRWNYARLNITANAQFGPNIVKEVRREFYLPLWNTYAYLVTYANMHGWTPSELPTDLQEQMKAIQKSGNTMDKWLMSKLAVLVSDVDSALEQYKLSVATRKIEEFIKDLSTWYIRRSRSRFREGDKSALSALYVTMVTLTKLIAPTAPFVAEHMYQNLVVGKQDDARQSVHLEDFPDVAGVDLDQELLDEMQNVRNVASLGLSIRDKVGIKLRQPLQKAYAAGIKSDELREVLAQELNVKEVVDLVDRAAFDALGLDVVELDDFKRDDYAANKELPTVLISQNDTFLAMEMAISEDLEKEGLLNELLRNMQVMRKKAGLAVEDKVAFEYATDDEIVKEVIESNLDLIKEKVNATAVDKKDNVDAEQELVNGRGVKMKPRR